MANWKIEYIKSGATYLLYDLTSNQTPALLSASLTLGTNTGGELQLQMVNDHVNYNAVEILKGEVRVWRGSYLTFRGYPTSIQTDFDGNKTIVFDGLVSMAALTPYPESTARTIHAPRAFDYTAEEILNAYVNPYVPQNAAILVETSDYNTANFTCQIPLGTGFDAVMTLLKQVNGYVIFNYNYPFENDWEDASAIGMKYYENDESRVNTQRITLGVNLISLEREQGAENYYNAVYPFNKGTATNPYPAHTLVGQTTDKPGYAIDQDGTFYNVAQVELYGYRVKAIDATGDTIGVSEMKEMAYQAIEGSLYDRISCEAIDESETPTGGTPFEVGKMVIVNSQPHGVNNVKLPLSAITRDLLNPESVKLTLGQRNITLSGNVIYS